MVKSEKSRDYLGPVTDTRIWDRFTLRPDDVIVTTPPKCGTTWMLNIVMMTLYEKVVPDAGNSRDAPWLDCAFRDPDAAAAYLDALSRRRCIKSHTPMDGIAYQPDPTYIAVYRHPVDAHFSLRSHAANMKNPMFDYMFPDNDSAGFHRFLQAPATDSGTDDFTIESIVHHYKSCKARQAGGNVHFFHYADLSSDLPGQIRRLADIMNMRLDPQLIREIAEATNFKSMRKAVESSARRFHKDSAFHDLAKFYASGTSGKWIGRLGEADMQAYHDRIMSLLSPEEVAWLEWGDQGA